MEHTKPSRSKRPQARVILFELPINGRSYSVSATPFTVASGDTLYRVSYNHGPVHVFGWDEGLDRYAETNPLADVIPPIVEMAIANKLNGYASEMQHAA